MKWAQPCILRGGTNLTNGTRYHNFQGGRCADSTATQGDAFDVVTCESGQTLSIREARAKRSAAPGVGTDATYTLYLATKAGGYSWAATALTLTFGAADTVARDLTNSVTGLVTGDLIQWRQSNTGTPAAATVELGVECDYSGAGFILFMNGLVTAVSASAARRIPGKGGLDPTATTNNVKILLPAAGTLSDFEVAGSASSGGGTKTYDVGLQINASGTGCPAAQLNSTTPQYNSDHSTTKAVAGDGTEFLHVEITPANTPTAIRIACSCVFTPTTTGDHFYSINAQASTSAANSLPCDSFISRANATESLEQAVITRYGRVKKVIAAVSVDPANGAGTQSWTIALRSNQHAVSSGIPTLTISEGATSDLSSWGSAHVLLQDGDAATGAIEELSYLVTPANTPATAIVYIAAVVQDISSSGTNESTLLNGLYAYYATEEASSAARIDATGRGNDLSNNVSVAQGTGINGFCADFASADSDFLNKATTGDLVVGLNPAANGQGIFTASGFVNLATKALFCLWGKWSSGKREWVTYFYDVDDRFEHATSSDGTNLTTNELADNLGSPSTGTWYLVENGYDGTNVWISGNGGTRDSTAQATGIQAQTEDFRIGKYDTGNFLNASVDEFGLWKRDLTGAESTTRQGRTSASFYPFTASSTSIKTFNGLAYASTKTVQGLAIASVKTWGGLT